MVKADIAVKIMVNMLCPHIPHVGPVEPKSFDGRPSCFGGLRRQGGIGDNSACHCVQKEGFRLKRERIQHVVLYSFAGIGF